MSDTLLNIPLPPNIWVDLYDATSFPVTTRLIVQNVGVCDVYLQATLTQPTDDIAHHVLIRGMQAINQVSDPGAWAFCLAGGAVNVKQVGQ